MKRVELSFAGLKIEFCDRERAIRQVEEFAEKGTWHPIVVFGPEGRGKTSWLMQAVEVLKELDFSVIYFNLMRREFLAEVGIKSVEEGGSRSVGAGFFGL
jgi:AAA+ ATPase superfamily predicted ATPase